VDSGYDTDRKSSLSFFSGGVDAFATLIAHANEQPSLITVWGSDITLEDLKGWGIVKNHTLDTARRFGVDAIFVKTNFRTFIHECLLNDLVRSSGDGWWHGFQHGIGLIGHAAPIAYQKKSKCVYIASSFTIREKGKVTCASDPSIDNFVRFCGAHVCHDQYEFCRQEKVEHIKEYIVANRLSVKLRVCWISSGGKNCCRCEKCLRTMSALFAEGANPREYGFEYSVSDLKSAKMIVLRSINDILIPFWEEIQQRIHLNPRARMPKELAWIKDCDFKRESRSVYVKVSRVMMRIKRKVWHILNSV